MSKKIKIPSVNIRSHLVDLFHTYLERTRKSYSNPYDDMDDEELMWLMQQQGYVFHDIIDDDYANFYDDDEDDANIIWPLKQGVQKSHKRTAKDIYAEFWGKEERKNKRKHRKGRKARVINITEPYDGEEEEDVNDYEYTSYEEMSDDNGVTDGKEIYYYPDYHDKDSRLEFSTLKAFNDFCDDNGYMIPTHVANQIMFNRVSHTCLHPQSREYGMYEIMAEQSYGGLFYEACDTDTELGG